MKIVFTPNWFLGPDVLIELFSFAILFLFFVLAIKNYKLSKNKSTFYLGIGFFLISLAEIFTIITKLVLYYDTTFTQEIGHMIVTYQIVKSVDIFYYIGFFFYKFLTLMGLYIIYKIPSKKGTIEDFLLVGFFIILSAIFSNLFSYVFHLATIFILGLIILNYHKIYKNNRSENTKILIIAFTLLAISHTIFLLSNPSILYVIGQSIQLVSYIILLFLIINITKHGQKKKPY